MLVMVVGQQQVQKRCGDTLLLDARQGKTARSFRAVPGQPRRWAVPPFNHGSGYDCLRSGCLTCTSLLFRSSSTLPFLEDIFVDR